MNADVTIREATAKDMPALIDFYCRLDHPGQREWISILMDGRHPRVNASHFVVAEDVVAGKIAASAITTPWTYRYCGQPLRGARLEEVFCEPEYQGKGLMKAILRRVAEKESQAGCLFQLVYGTNAVYHHLGYTYGLPNEEEGFSYILKSEPVGGNFVIREADDADIPAMARLYEPAYTRNLLATQIGVQEITYMKNTYAEGSFYVIATANGDTCGFFHTQLDDKRVYMMEIDGSVSYRQIRPYVIAFYEKMGFDRIHFKLGKDHPVYNVFRGFYHKKLLSELGFVKVDDISKLLMGVSDVLCRRLALSPYAHLTREFILSVHSRDEAYRLSFADGRLACAAPVSAAFGDVCVERGRLIRMIFGRVSASEMRQEFSMYYFGDEDLRAVFEILFPEAQSHVVSVN